MKCPGFERLLDYLDGRLAGEDAQVVAAHLEGGCKRCAENREWLERVRAIAASDDRSAPPLWVLQRARHLFDSQTVRAGALDRLGRLVAALIFDSLTPAAVYGVRLAQSGNRQLVYRADLYSVDLQIASAHPAAANLIGQVLRQGEAGFQSVARLSLELIRENQIVGSTYTNAVGQFAFNGIECGEYDLQVKAHGATIIIAPLPIVPS
ncbi:MAG: hypothetical protein V7641_4786 [Blastocatellia bacterium]